MIISKPYANKLLGKKAKEKKRKVLASNINKSAIIKVIPKQTGKTNILRDKTRDARLPGKRTSKTGKVYWETRKNRSDLSAIKRL